MNKNGPYLVALLSVIAMSLIIPAHAEVTSLKIGSSFYKGGSVVQFSGTTLNTDPPNVTIIIFDPNNKFILLASGLTDSNHAFQVNVDTSLPSNQQLFSLKGVYNATGFIANQASGKTIAFAFSPDGSSIFPSAPTNLIATPVSPSEVDLSWLAPQNSGGLVITGYQIERNDGSGFNIIAHLQTTTYKDMGLAQNSEHAYRVSAINSAGSGIPSNSAPVITLPSSTTTPSAPSPSTDQNPSQSLSDILQQRYETAKKLQEMLNGKTSGPSSNPSPTPSQSSQQTVHLNENIDVGDKAANLESTKSSSMLENNLIPNSLPSFDVKTILYPAISLVGIGIVVTILYSRKKRKIAPVVKESQEARLPIEQTLERHDDDYAMTILKNRLAKGEITVDEFKALKDELSEP